MTSRADPLFAVWFSLAAAGFSLAGCEDAPPVALPDGRAAASSPRWQDVSGTTPPDLWLAGIDAGRPAEPGSKAVAAFGALLDEASGSYIETPRMVANRLVQAKDTIEATPSLGTEDATLEPLFRRLLFRTRDGQKLLFGTVVHHYLNLRRQGLDEEAAADRVAAEFDAERMWNGR